MFYKGDSFQLLRNLKAVNTKFCFKRTKQTEKKTQKFHKRDIKLAT